ncbi:MAG: hypothetical protein IJ298_02970 [Ruminococcus sp.]|nr:hypothetical protein [Ruminococcus sp.]
MIKSRKLLCLVFAVLIIICSAMFTACAPKDTDPTVPSTDATTTQVTTTAEPVTTTAATVQLKLSASYIPTKAFDSNGAEASVYTVYGSSFRDYGGSLCFKEDGTFTTFIGVFGNVDNESGTYKIISDTEIEMLYNNDKTETAIITQVDSEGNVVELKMPHRSFDVVFTQE